MTKEQFKQRWESDDDGGGITWDEIADVAVEWGVCSFPQTRPMSRVLDLVLAAAGCDSQEREKEESGDGDD